MATLAQPLSVNITAKPRALGLSTPALLLLAVFVLRMVYLIWLNPCELAGDEAYYWVQSRHLEMCYDEKGPALPWLIAACCRAFGDHEWSIRLTMAVSSFLAGWAIVRLTRATGENDRSALYAVACFCLIPAFQANAQICTQDGPIILLWALLTLAALRLFRRWRADQRTWDLWLLLYGLMGLAILFKQSAPLFFLGMAVYAFIQRRRLSWRWSMLLSHAAGLVLLALMLSPMILWNQRHGWPMLARTLGYVGAGGDQAGEPHRGNSLTWLGATLGGIAGSFGPALALMIWASLRAWQDHRKSPASAADRLWLVCASWPAVFFFIALSTFKPVVPSWPLPSLVPLVVLVGQLCATELPRYRALLSAAWPTSRRPDTPFHRTWVATLIYGLCAWLLISFPTALAHLPLVGHRLQHSVLRRITGHRQDAARLAQALDAVRGQHPQPIIVARYYMQASLMSFYLPGHPTVLTADKYLGKRATNFALWSDTRLDNPSLLGKPLLFIGQSDIEWEKVFAFDRLQPLDHGAYYLGTNYRGPRQDNPRLALASR